MMPGTVTVRAPYPEDLARLASLCEQLGYPVTREAVERRLAQVLSREDQYLAVAAMPAPDSDVIARVVGFIHLHVTVDVLGPPRPEIGALVVDETVRSRGVGGALLHAGEAWARTHGFERLRVRSQLKRDRAHAFYRRAGYAWVKTQHVFEKAL